MKISKYVIASSFCMAILLILLTSYCRSLVVAYAFTGRSLIYFDLSSSGIDIIRDGDSKIVWFYRFSLKNSYDEDFTVYTTFSGNIVKTRPYDLDGVLEYIQSKRYSNVNRDK